MGHFSFYERIPPAGRVRGRLVQSVRRSIRWLLWTRFLAQEVRFQKIYDATMALRAEQRRLDSVACIRLAMQRRLEFMERAIAALESKHEPRIATKPTPRSRVA
ncbi:hypothetical protein BH10PLA2_BH10PLA2_12740 [soil metagenome]